MQVGRERKSAVARQTNDVATAHLLAPLHVNAREVAVLGFVAPTVVDDYGATGGGLACLNLLHGAIGCSKHTGAHRHGIVHTLVRGKALVEGVDAHTVGGGQQGEFLVDNRLNCRDIIGL